MTWALSSQGIIADISDRPSICSSVDWVAGEAIIGSSDHALYGVDVNTGRVRRTLYTKKCGHTECGPQPHGPYACYVVCPL